MDENEVIEAINYLRKYRVETDRIEVKTAKGGFPKRCYDTFSSFSNKYGGIIIFGISEDKDFITEGVYDINDLQKQITDLCSDSMEPTIRPVILAFEFEGKNILAVKIEEIIQNKKPCYYKPSGIKNGSYTRVGDRDDKMTDYELYALQSYNDHVFEDTRPSKRADIEDLNVEELHLYIEKVKSNKPHFAKNSFNKSLKLCGIIDSNKERIYPTLAGVMIFGEYPQSFYPQLFVACVVVPGTELGDTGKLGERFIDNKRIEGTLEEMLNGTMSFLRRNMKTSVIIDENGNRTNRTEYPLEALREAVANALIHRDYSTQTENAYISVNMYEDRIEVINPGTLYGTNKLEKLGTATTMEARNPTIVKILEEKGAVIENRHSGIPTMKREMKKYGLPEPEYYEERDSFKVIFRNGVVGDLENDIQSGQQNVQRSGQQNVQQSGQQNVQRSGQQNVQQSGQQNVQRSGQQNEQRSGQQKEQRSGRKGQQSKQQKVQQSGQQNVQQSGQQKEQQSGQQNEQRSGQQKSSLEKYKESVLILCLAPKTLKEIKSFLKIKSRQYLSANIIKPLIDDGKLEYTNKSSINARNQKYRTKK